MLSPMRLNDAEVIIPTTFGQTLDCTEDECQQYIANGDVGFVVQRPDSPYPHPNVFCSAICAREADGQNSYRAQAERISVERST